MEYFYDIINLYYSKERGADIVSYEKLWKLLKDKGMKKKDLMQEAGISKSTVVKLNHGKSVTTDTLSRICKVLHCDMGDIMEYIPDGE